MHEVYEYALQKLNEEIHQLEVSLSINNYSKGQQENLERKLKGLYEKIERFKGVELI